MKVMTGEDHADASAMIEYFQPLLDWSKQQNQGPTLGWKPAADPLKAC